MRVCVKIRVCKDVSVCVSMLRPTMSVVDCTQGVRVWGGE